MKSRILEKYDGNKVVYLIEYVNSHVPKVNALSLANFKKCVTLFCASFNCKRKEEGKKQNKDTRLSRERSKESSIHPTSHENESILDSDIEKSEVRSISLERFCQKNRIVDSNSEESRDRNSRMARNESKDGDNSLERNENSSRILSRRRIIYSDSEDSRDIIKNLEITDNIYHRIVGISQSKDYDKSLERSEKRSRSRSRSGSGMSKRRSGNRSSKRNRKNRIRSRSRSSKRRRRSSKSKNRSHKKCKNEKGKSKKETEEVNTRKRKAKKYTLIVV